MEPLPESQALGLYWPREGLKVVPTLSWAGPDSYAFCFEGVSKRSTVAVSTVGVKRDAATLDIWRDGMAEAMRRLAPSRVLLYGGDVGFDFGGCEVVEYANGITERVGRLRFARQLNRRPHGWQRCEQRERQTRETGKVGLDVEQG